MHRFHHHCSPFSPFSHSARWMYASCRSASLTPSSHLCSSSQIRLHHPSVMLLRCQSTLNGFSLDLPSTKSRQCPVEHTHVPGGAVAAVRTRGPGEPLVIYYFHNTENNCVKQTESHVYQMDISDLLAWVHTFVDTHPDRGFCFYLRSNKYDTETVSCGVLKIAQNSQQNL